MYVQDIKSKICDGNAIPTVLKDKYSTALVNGQNSLGPVVGNFCMNLAIEKAKKHGVGWVAANSKLGFVFSVLIPLSRLIFLADSNHYGIAGWYSMLAANQGLMVNSILLLTEFLLIVIICSRDYLSPAHHLWWLRLGQKP